MTTVLAASQARAAQTVADRQAAEQALAKAMRKIDPGYDRAIFPVAEAISFRCWESLLEMEHPPAGFAQAYTAFRRAQRLEARARSAVHRAQFEIQQPSGSAGAPVSLTAEEVLAGLQERRRAA